MEYYKLFASEKLTNITDKYKDDYDNDEKYYLRMIEKGNIYVINNLAHHYQNYGKYDLMKKYYTLAIENGDVIAMFNFGWYYGFIEKKYDLMKKYWLMVIEKGGYPVMHELGCYYKKYSPNEEDLQKYLIAIIDGNFYFESVNLFTSRDNHNCLNKQIIDLFCKNIKIINNRNYYFCLSEIIYFICSLSIKSIVDLLNYNFNFKNFRHFAKYVSKLYYKNKNKYNKKNRNKKNQNNESNKNKKCVQKILKKNGTQLLMEWLDIYYYKSLEKIYAPGGKEYTKIKNHFELTVNENKK